MTQTGIDTTIGGSRLDDTAFEQTDPATGDGGTSLNDVGHDAAESVGQLAGRAADVGLQRADQGKDQAAQTISRLAGSMRQVSTDLEGEQPMIAGAARTAAEQAERLATYMERTDTRQIIGTVEDAARRQPLLFLGGAFVLGVAAARLLKAGTDMNQDRMRDGQTNGYRSTRAAEFDGRTSRRS
jgi:hypothetical protein